ncbi:MAG TPA: hypothetical protein VL625_08875 [Patescibacteria group bacterium]|nr:hypothetical protein [Patescibacteria group bacterium]
MGIHLEGYDQKRMQDLQKSLTGENVNVSLISMKDALYIAKSDRKPEEFGLTTDQLRLVTIVKEMQKTELGRDLTQKAAAKDVWLTVDNKESNGSKYNYYSSDKNVVAFAFHDKPGAGANNPSAQPDVVANEVTSNYLGTAYHELGHFYQHDYLHNGQAPADLRSFDKRLWELSVEAQADQFEAEGLRQTAIANGQPAPPQKDRFNDFVNTIRNDDFHKAYYGVERGSLHDGRAVTGTEYAAAFGVVPGTPGNFMQDRIKTTGDLYRTIVYPDAKLSDRFNKESQQEAGIQFSRDDLLDRNKRSGVSVTESPKDGIIMVASKTSENGNDKYELKAFKKINGADPNSGYTMIDYKAAQQAAGSTPPALSVTDTKGRGAGYKFEAKFDEKGVQSDIAKQNPKSGHFDVVAETKSSYNKAEPYESPVVAPPAKTDPAGGSKTPVAPVGTPPKTSAGTQPNPDDVKAIQTELKRRGMYNGPEDGQWNADVNHGLNRYLHEAQQRGTDNGTYHYKVDQIYGTRTQASMEAAIKAKDPAAPSIAMLKALNDMRDSGALRAVYHKEDLSASGPAPIVTAPPTVAPISTPVGGQLTPPKTGPGETYTPPVPPRTPPGSGNGTVPPVQSPQYPPQTRLPQGAVDLTGMTRVDKYGSLPVTLYDGQGGASRVMMDPHALSGVVQVSRDPRMPNNVLLSVSDRDGQNSTAYSMSPSDAGRMLAGYGSPANPLYQQLRGINFQIVAEQANARQAASTPERRWEAAYGQPPYSSGDSRATRSSRDFPTAPQMGAAFTMESRGVGPYATMMAQREAMIMAQRERIIMNAGGFEPRERGGVSVNIGIRLGR